MSSLRPSPDPAPTLAGKPGSRELLRPGCAHPSDVSLLQRVVRREAGAIDEFTARMQCIARFLWVRNAKLGGVLRREELEDVAQDVLVAIWRKLEEYRGDARLETWALQFCEFDLQNARRRATRRRGMPIEDVPEPGTAAAAVEPPGDLEAVYRAMGNLTPEESVVVRLKNFEALKFEEIAERLAISSNTVKTRYYRALEKLRVDLRRRREREE